MVNAHEPSSAIFHRSLTASYPTARAGQGVYIITSDNTWVLDGSSGAAVSCLGHGNRDIIEAIVEQSRSLAFAHTSFFTSNVAEELAADLLLQSQGCFEKCMFLSSGSEAVESALKLTRQYHVANGQAERVNIIGREFAYHGNTLGALAAGNNPSRRKTFEPMLAASAFHHAPRYFYSHDANEEESEAEYADRMIRAYEELFDQLGPKTVAAVILEPVGGATLGAVSSCASYLQALRALCDRHGVLLIYDEVMCGMGRMGTLHAWQSLEGPAPDLQTIGKGLGAGYQPISGILVGGKVHESIKATATEHPFVSGHTYQGHSIGCAAALATQRVIRRDRLLENVQKMGTLLSQLLRDEVPNLREVRGHGLFVAVEFAAMATADARPLAPEVAQACLQNGAAVYLCSAAADAVLFAPPFIITEGEVRELVSIFTASCRQVLAQRNV